MSTEAEQLTFRLETQMVTMTGLPVSAQKRIDEGGVIIHWPEGGIVANKDDLHARRAVAKLPYGSGICLCSACGHLFKSLKGFDKHQLLDNDGHVICFDPGSIGQLVNVHGQWITESHEGATHSASKQA